MSLETPGTRPPPATTSKGSSDLGLAPVTFGNMRTTSGHTLVVETTAVGASPFLSTARAEHL
jgi:hypothetical protein